MKRVLFMFLSLAILTSCSKDDDNETGVLSLSVYYHFEDTPEVRHLAKTGYCWFGLFDCEQSAISADLQDVYNIGDKKVVTLKDGKTIQPQYATSTDIGTCTLQNVAFGKYTVVCVYRNGVEPTSSHYYYYGTKTLNIDNPAANTCRFDFELGMNNYGKLINQ